MKVKCISNYYDTQLKKTIKAGDQLEVADARATVLVNAKVAEELPTPTPKVATKKTKKVED